VHLCRALKAPSLLQALPTLEHRAEAERWSQQEFLAACLEREVSGPHHPRR
jgi:hypothetical protein